MGSYMDHKLDVYALSQPTDINRGKGAFSI